MSTSTPKTSTTANAHLDLDGTWQSCTTPACPLPYHLPATLHELNAGINLLAMDLIAEELQQGGEYTPMGNICWYDDERNLHRDYDLPAQIHHGSGFQTWWQHGVRHRVNGPAIITTSGEQHWFRDGILHRTDGPAITYGNSALDTYDYYEQGAFLYRMEHGQRLTLEDIQRQSTL